jgi:hypothetical protein
MLRFKLFSGQGADLENEVNRWLGDFEPDVNQMVQTVDASGTLSIAFLFEESFRGQEKRYTAERGQARTAQAAIPVGAPEESARAPAEPPGGG